MSVSTSGGARAARDRLRVDRGTLVRAVVIAALLAFVLLGLPTLVGTYWLTVSTAVAIYAIVALGAGLLYGRVGMVSLCQIALLALGAWVAARLLYATSIPFPLVLLIAGVVTAAIGVIIGLPALRLQGLYFALITLMGAGALAIVLQVIHFPNGGGGFTGVTSDALAIRTIRRPDLATSDIAFFRYTVVVAVLMFLLALWHVSGKPGRAWAAIRESEPAAVAAGVHITQYKLWASVASFLAGVAGGVGASRAALDRPLCDPGVDHPAGRDADGRDLQPVGGGDRRPPSPARTGAPAGLGTAVRDPDRPLRRGHPAGPADRSRGPRGAGAEGPREPGRLVARPFRGRARSDAKP